MKLILTLVLCSWTITTIAQTKKSIRGRQFELKGKIINSVSLPPDCGTIAWGTVIEFEIIEFSNPGYKSETIPVIFTCPEFYKDNFFIAGRTYKVTIADENQADFGWSIPNISILDKYRLEKKLWAIEATKVE